MLVDVGWASKMNHKEIKKNTRRKEGREREREREKEPFHIMVRKLLCIG